MSSMDKPQQIQQELIKHLNTLYGSQSHSQRDAFEAANKFLMEFNKHPQAWSICLSILIEISNTNDNNENNILILRFSAQTIYDGVLENWQNINIEQRRDIITKLKMFIESFSTKYLFSYLDLDSNNNNNNNAFKSSFRFIFNKMSQCIAFLALNGKQGINIIDGVFNSCSNIKLPEHLSLLWVNLEILNGFALEFEQQHVSQTIIQHTQNILNTRKYRDKLLTIIMYSLGASKYKNILYRLIEISFSTLKHWINIVDVTLQTMDSIGLLQETLNIMYLLYKTTNNNTNNVLKCRQFMVESMIKITRKGIHSKQDTAQYNKILTRMCNAFTTLKPFIENALKTNDTSTLQSICNLICNFCENEIDFIVSASTISCLELISFILQFTAYSSTIITTETFAFWLRLQDIPLHKRHKSLCKNVFSQLLESLLLHSKHCTEFDKYSRFQTNSSELFISIYFILAEQYFIQVFKQLNIFLSANNLVGIESCIFALRVIALEIRDEQNKKEIETLLHCHIKPICEILLNISVPQENDLNGSTYHLFYSICLFLRGYSFYLCRETTLLQKCLLFNIELPRKCKYKFRIMIFECSKTFESLLYHSISHWMNELNEFENIIKFITQQIGQGELFYTKLTRKELQLLSESDAVISDNPVIKQQYGISTYYEALCMILDVYNNKNRQKQVINTLISVPIKTLNNINNINENILYDITANLYIFKGIICGLKTTHIDANHPVIAHMESILNICNKFIKINKNENEILYSAICEVIESILIIFGGSTINVLNDLIQIVLQILKNTKSQASARILKKMVSTFSNSNVGNNLIKLIFEIIVYFNDDSCDIELFHETINEMFDCVDIILKNNNNNNFDMVWHQIVPNCISLSLKILIKIQDRAALSSALKILSKIFDRKYEKSLQKISVQLKQSLLPNIINILFAGITKHFERMIAGKVYDLYFNLLQFDDQYVREQTILEIRKLKINAFQDDKNKELFIKAFWSQRTNKRKFNLVMTTFFSVCHNFDTPDSFAGMID